MTDCRDLGAHRNATEGRWYGETLTSRMLQVADETERLNRIKAPYVKNAALLWAKKMPDGGQAVLVINLSNAPLDLKVALSDVGLPAAASVKARDVWAHADLGTVSGTWTITALQAHDSQFVVFSST